MDDITNRALDGDMFAVHALVVERDALRAENAELVEAMCHPSYEEENRLRAELAALREQLEYYRRYAAPKPGEGE